MVFDSGVGGLTVARAILDQLPVVDFNIEDIPVEEGIALLYQRREATHAAS